jgi:hypothetical protein
MNVCCWALVPHTQGTRGEVDGDASHLVFGRGGIGCFGANEGSFMRWGQSRTTELRGPGYCAEADVELAALPIGSLCNQRPFLLGGQIMEDCHVRPSPFRGRRTLL